MARSPQMPERLETDRRLGDGLGEAGQRGLGSDAALRLANLQEALIQGRLVGDAIMQAVFGGGGPLGERQESR